MPAQPYYPDQEILPPIPDRSETAPDRAEAVVLSTDLPPELEFDIIPHAPKGGQKFTPDMQRMFINALAACGSVTTSARAVSMSMGQMYYLRNRAGSESFAAAWDKAVARGARRVLDILVDQCINGTPEYIFKDGQLVAERRHFNTRSMMWIVAHHMPEMFGITGGLMHQPGNPAQLKRLKQQWQREWYEEARAKQPSAEDARATILKNVDAVRRPLMIALARDPEKRAAYELIYGPTDWSAFE